MAAPSFVEWALRKCIIGNALVRRSWVPVACSSKDDGNAAVQQYFGFCLYALIGVLDRKVQWGNTEVSRL
jgi:hypothetical protein